MTNKMQQHLKVAGLMLLLVLGSAAMAAKPATQPSNSGGDVSTQGFIFNR